MLSERLIAAIGALGKREMAPPTFVSLSCIKIATSRKGTVSYFNANASKPPMHFGAYCLF